MGGVRDELAKKRVVLDADLYMLPQGIITGGKDKSAEFWGNAHYTLDLDIEKMGLWAGGFFKFEGISSFGNTLYSDVGALVPTNFTYLFPGVNEADSGLMQATFTQFFSPTFGLFMGKVNTLDFMATEFYGDYRNQFSNTALNFSMAYAMLPISSYGGGLLWLPTKNIALLAVALNVSGSPLENDVGKAFDEGTTVLSAANIKIKPFGLVGHQSISGVWSDKPRFSLDQDPTNL